MKLPRHHSCSIEHNPHKAVYYNVLQHIEMCDHYKECVTPEDLAICIEKDEIWHFQWYPRTPISFELVISYSLERCLELAREISGELYDY